MAQKVDKTADVFQILLPRRAIPSDSLDSSVFTRGCIAIFKMGWELQTQHPNSKKRRMAISVSTFRETLEDDDSALVTSSKLPVRLWV